MLHLGARHKTVLAVASVVGVVSLVAGACGSSSKSAGTSGTASTTATTAPATSGTSSSSSSTSSTSSSSSAVSGASGTTGSGVNEPLKTATGTSLKIGYICECVGAQESAVVDAQPAIVAWKDWQNAHGGINGHPVDLIRESDPGNPGVALTEVETLVKDGVVGLIDADGTDDTSWTTYIEKTGIPVFPTGFNAPAMAENPDAFSTAVNEFFLVDEIILAAKKAGAHKIAVLYCAESPACAQTVAPLEAGGKALGVPVVFVASILASAPSYTAQCLAAKQHGADAMFVADAPAPVLAVAADCAQQGYTPHQVSDDGAYSQSFNTAPGMSGFIATEDDLPFFVTSTPGGALMHNAFNQYEPSITKSPDYDEVAVVSWTTGLLVAAAATAGAVGTTNPITPAALTSGVYTLHSTNLGGMTPTLTFVKGQPQFARCWIWVGVANGKWVTPYGLTPACAPPLKS